MPIKLDNNSRLDILVENQGRFSYTGYNETKGIIDGVYLIRANDDNELKTKIKNWKHYLFFKNWEQTVEKLQNKTNSSSIKLSSRIPTFFTGRFKLPNDSNLPFDSFLRLDGWGKGVAFLNGFNLGRYWPLAGPQVTLYAPSHLFKSFPEENVISVFELQRHPCMTSENNCVVKFVKEHELNGTLSDD